MVCHKGKGLEQSEIDKLLADDEAQADNFAGMGLAICKKIV